MSGNVDQEVYDTVNEVIKDVADQSLRDWK